MSKSIIFYTYYQSKSSDYNLNYFVKCIKYSEFIDYIIIINGYNCNIKIPNYDNLKILKRDNIGFDTGGHKAALDTITDLNEYDYFFFLNSSVTGPFFKNKSDDKNWTHFFTEKITNDVKLVSTSICFLKQTDKGGYGPKAEGFFCVTDLIGLKLMLNEGNIFCNHKTFEDAIINGEYGKTRCMFKHNYNIDCMLQKYQNIDWRNSKNWDNNKLWYNKPASLWPSKLNSYFNENINPYEVIFHKYYWKYNNSYISYDIIDNHIKSFDENIN